MPATPFTWEETAAYQGPVKIPVGPGGSWFYTKQGQWRLVASFTSDPTFEVIVYAPYSGHATANERFLVQVPAKPLGGIDIAQGMVIGFHPANISEKSVFQGTALPAICKERKWILVSPFGLSQLNFGNVHAQTCLEEVLKVLAVVFPFNQERIYTVGFSMGGINAVSFAMRHLDKGSFRVAGVVNHTGTMDAEYVYNEGSKALKAVLENDLHFDGSPTVVPFNYNRISPIKLSGLAVNPHQAPVTNIKNLPIYIHYNTLDPNSRLKTETMALISYLQSLGANVHVDTVDIPGLHWWSSMDMFAAIDWVGRYELGPDPLDIELFADQRAKYLYTEVLKLITNQVARYEVSVGPGNSFLLTNTSAVRILALDVVDMGLDVNSPLSFTADSADGTTDVIVLQGYGTAPTSVLEGASPANVAHYPDRGELVITPAFAGSTFTITP